MRKVFAGEQVLRNWEQFGLAEDTRWCAALIGLSRVSKLRQAVIVRLSVQTDLSSMELHHNAIKVRWSYGMQGD